MCSVSHIFVLPMQFISKYNLYCHKMRKTNKSGSDRMWQTRASKHKLWIICEWMGFFPFTQSSENAWIQNYASFMFAMMEHHIIGIYVCIFDETITHKMRWLPLRYSRSIQLPFFFIFIHFRDKTKTIVPIPSTTATTHALSECSNLCWYNPRVQRLSQRCVSCGSLDQPPSLVLSNVPFARHQHTSLAHSVIHNSHLSIYRAGYTEVLA